MNYGCFWYIKRHKCDKNARYGLFNVQVQREKLTAGSKVQICVCVYAVSENPLCFFLAGGAQETFSYRL